jgi:NMD protein affecting ribosome stability and mRNA decay
MARGKGLIRSGNRKGVTSGKAPLRRTGSPPERGGEPQVCQKCGAVWSRRTWRRDRRVNHALLARAKWSTCSACRQVAEGQYFGRILLRGAYVRGHEEAIRRRIDNVAGRAGHTQPERRVVSIERGADGLEVLTTSQKLAHRIVHEMRKAFRGRASYSWSDTDGSLLAVWQRDA